MELVLTHIIVDVAKALGGSFKLVTLTPKTVRVMTQLPRKHKRMGIQTNLAFAESMTLWFIVTSYVFFVNAGVTICLQYYNKNNNRFSVAPYGRNFTGAGGRIWLFIGCRGWGPASKNSCHSNLKDFPEGYAAWQLVTETRVRWNKIGQLHDTNGHFPNDSSTFPRVAVREIAVVNQLRWPEEDVLLVLVRHSPLSNEVEQILLALARCKWHTLVRPDG